MVIHPRNEYDGEAQRKCHDGWHNVLESEPKICIAANGGDRRQPDVNNQECQRDREYAVAKTFQSRIGI